MLDNVHGPVAASLNSIPGLSYPHMCTFVSSILYFSEWLRRVKTCFGWCRFDCLTLVLQCLGYLDRTLPDKQNSSRRWTFQRPATRWCENMQLPCIGNLMTLLGGIPWNCLTTDMQLKGRRTAVAKSFFVLLSFLYMFSASAQLHGGRRSCRNFL